MKETDFAICRFSLYFSSLGSTRNGKAGKNTEWAGPCLVCRPKNETDFSFQVNGRFRCFSWPAKSRGAIDLTMPVR
jgi:hypothetical protein